MYQENYRGCSARTLSQTRKRHCMRIIISPSRLATQGTHDFGWTPIDRSTGISTKRVKYLDLGSGLCNKTSRAIYFHTYILYSAGNETIKLGSIQLVDGPAKILLVGNGLRRKQSLA